MEKGAEKVMARHIIMKARHDGTGHAEQVYSDKFSDYDYAWNLMQWLNRASETHSYWLEESEVK